MKEERVFAEGESLVYLEMAGQTRVRLMRVTVYEGTYSEVKTMIAKSLPVGQKDTTGSSHLTVFQGQYEIINQKGESNEEA